MSYLVQCHDNAMWRSHVDHIQETTVTREMNDSSTSDSDETFMSDILQKLQVQMIKKLLPVILSQMMLLLNWLLQDSSSSSSETSQDLPMTRFILISWRISYVMICILETDSKTLPFG